jgi:hypothetical protein
MFMKILPKIPSTLIVPKKACFVKSTGATEQGSPRKGVYDTICIHFIVKPEEKTAKVAEVS